MRFLPWKKIVLLILAVAITLCGSGCYVRSDAERFDEYVSEIFRQMLAGDALSLNIILANPENYGIETDTVSFGAVLPDETLEEAGMTWEESIDAQIALMEFLFDYEELTASQQITYNQLLYYLEASRNYEGLEYYEEYCVGSRSVVTNLPLMLAEFNFRTEKDIETYLALLETYDTYFPEIVQYEQKKSELGLFMSDTSLDGFLENCQSFLDSGEENVLLVSFANRIAAFQGLDTKTAEDYIAQNKNIVETVVMPAYQKLFEEMEKLRGTGKNEGGICHLPNGKQYYEYWTGRTVGTDKTIDEIYAMLSTAMTTYQTELLRLLTEHPELEQELTEFSFKTGEPEEILEYLKENTKEDYPEIPEVNYTIKSIPSYLSNTNVAGFYIMSPIDAMENQIIYVNDAKHFASAEVFSTLAHEGYPGHLYQTVYFLNGEPEPLRYALGTTGYQEGWASYVEKESYAYCGIEDENLVLALQLNSAYELLFYAYLDIAVNYKGMDFQSFYTMLQPMGIEEASARMAYQSYVEDPGVYLPYAVGFLEFQELRETAEEALGSDFVLKEFHRTVLELGAVPFPLLREHVEAWLQEATVTEAI